MANAGGVIAYAPLLTLLLPMKIEAMRPALRIELLSATTIVGAIVAGLANIGFGMASDRSHRRRGSRNAWIIAGLMLNGAAYALLAAARTPFALVAAVAIFQIAVNMILAPLSAMMADSVPDADKGLGGGALALGPAAGAVTAMLLTASTSLGESMRLAIIACAVPVCIVPLLTLPPIFRDHPARPPNMRKARRYDLARLSLARLVVQIATSTVFTYLLFYFETLIDTPALPRRLAALTLIAFLSAFPAGLAVGRWSDRNGQRQPFLLGAALAATAALVAMGWSTQATGAAIAYVVFATSSSVFLSLQATYIMQVLPSASHRGRDLGIANLANTLPVLISATLVLNIAGQLGFKLLMSVLAALVLLGGVITVRVRSEA